MEYVLASALLLVAIRWWLAGREESSSLTEGDGIGHLDYVQNLHANGGRVGRVPKFILDSDDYPQGFHWIFWRVGVTTRWLEAWGDRVAGSIDGALVAVVGLAMERWGGPHHAWILTLPFLKLLVAHSGRASNFTARPFGALTGNVYLVGLCGFMLEGEPTWLVASVVASCLLASSSKFAIQAVAGISLWLALLLVDLRPLLVLAACGGASILLTRGYTARVVSGLARHARFYRTHLAARHLAVARHYRQLWAGLLFRRPSLRAWYRLYRDNSIARVVSDVPLNLAVIYAIASAGTSSLGLFEAWFVAGLLLLLVTGTDWLRFLGEPERYLEYSLVPVFVVLSRHDAHQLAPSSWVALALLVPTFALHLRSSLRRTPGGLGQAARLRLVRETLAELRGARILTVPLRLSYLLAYHLPENEYVMFMGNVPEGALETECRALVPDHWPYPAPDLASLARHHGATLVVVDKSQVQSLEAVLGRPYYSFVGIRAIHEDDAYAVFEVEQSARDSSS